MARTLYTVSRSPAHDQLLGGYYLINMWPKGDNYYRLHVDRTTASIFGTLQDACYLAYGQWDLVKQLKHVRRDDRNRNKLKREDACYWCSGMEKLTTDHLIPLGRRGLHNFNNMSTACYACNQEKGSKLPHDYALQCINSGKTLTERAKSWL